MPPAVVVLRWWLLVVFVLMVVESWFTRQVSWDGVIALFGLVATLALWIVPRSARAIRYRRSFRAYFADASITDAQLGQAMPQVTKQGHCEASTQVEGSNPPSARGSVIMCIKSR